MPDLPVGGEDAIAEERVPQVVESLSLAVRGELGRQNGFDVLRVPSFYIPLAWVDMNVDALPEPGRVGSIKEMVEVSWEGAVHLGTGGTEEPYCA